MLFKDLNPFFSLPCTCPAFCVSLSCHRRNGVRLPGRHGGAATPHGSGPVRGLGGVYGGIRCLVPDVSVVPRPGGKAAEGRRKNRKGWGRMEVEDGYGMRSIHPAMPLPPPPRRPVGALHLTQSFLFLMGSPSVVAGPKAYWMLHVCCWGGIRRHHDWNGLGEARLQTIFFPFVWNYVFVLPSIGHWCSFNGDFLFLFILILQAQFKYVSKLCISWEWWYWNDSLAVAYNGTVYNMLDNWGDYLWGRRRPPDFINHSAVRFSAKTRWSEM